MLRKMLKLAGKDDFSLDENISTIYIIRLCWKYGWMLFRGFGLSSIHRTFGSGLFVGKKVVLYEKKNIYLGDKVKLHDYVKIDALSTHGVHLGDKVILGKNTVIEATGGLSHVGKGVEIGANSTFGNDCFFGAAGGITVGCDVVAGQFIRFHSENHNYDNVNMLIKDQGVTHKGIVVGDNCWIGSGVVFLDGAHVGKGCVIAANAVVTKSFPDNSVIAGVPAKIIARRGDDGGIN